MGYLNSRLFNFVYHTMFGGLSMLGSIQMQAPQIRKSLIPKWDNVYNNQQPIIRLVDRVLTIKNQAPSADTSALESEIDRLVYQLYGLTDEEIAIIEKM